MVEVIALSDAETRRHDIVVAASAIFARSGYAGTPVSAVAQAAGISQAYVFKLFPTKLDLFLAITSRNYDRIVAALTKAADKAGSGKSDKVLEAMSAAYLKLIGKPDMLMLQMHAQAAADVPEIRDAVRHGTSRIVATVKARTDAKKKKIQRFMADAQLCLLVTSLDAVGDRETWARILTDGLAPEA